MPVNVQWYVENSILLVEYIANVTIAERQAGSAQMIAYFDGATRPIHVIGDWRHGGDWPAIAGVTAQSLDAVRHQNMGRLAVVGMSATLQNWIEVLSQLNGLDYVVANSVEEAARKLRAGA